MEPRRQAWRVPLLSLTAVTLVLAGCGRASEGAAAPATTAPRIESVVISAAGIAPGQAVPAPAGEPVLTLSGRITRHNQGSTLVLDEGLLARLGVSKVELFEPWTKKNLAFQGVWLADLLAVAGADPAATSVHATALDDYQVDVTTADVRAGGIFLATRDGKGEPLPIEDGGPTRIVFVGGVASGRSDDQWIWSLKTLDVR